MIVASQDGNRELPLARPKDGAVARFAGVLQSVGFVDSRAELVGRVVAGVRVVDVEASLVQSKLVFSTAWAKSDAPATSVAVGATSIATSASDGVKLVGRGELEETRLGSTCPEPPELLFSRRGDLVIAVCPSWVRAWETRSHRLVYEYTPEKPLAALH